MKKLLSFLFIIVILSACSRMESPTASPSGEFKMTTRVESDFNNENYGLIFIDVYDSQEHLFQTLDTGASDFMKWAEAWSESKDRIILYSSDIGTQAWEFNGEEFENVPVTEEIKMEGQELKSKKYD